MGGEPQEKSRAGDLVARLYRWEVAGCPILYVLNSNITRKVLLWFYY